jgi:putative tricarboxylic transport membrane protein
MGTILGAAPGLGPNAAGLIAHGQGRLIARDSNYGQGSLEGVAVAESANSSVNGANLLPLVTLGIPGSGEAAVLMAAFLLHGMEVGPLLIRNYPEIIYRMFAGMLMANAGILVIGLLTMRHFVRAVTIPRNVLFPMILVLCFVGTWAREPLVIHLFMLVVFGILGYVMNKTGFSTPAFTIGFILGRIGEYSYNQTLIIARGNFWSILNRPAFLVVLFLLFIIFFFALYVTRRKIVTGKPRNADTAIEARMHKETAENDTGKAKNGGF